MPGPVVVPVEARSRVWFDDNAGSWVYCRPGGRLPVQAESWPAAIEAALAPVELRKLDQLDPAEFRPPLPWWRRLFAA